MKELIDYIKNNPYRVLGVYANDSEKKWVENSLELFVSLKRDNSFMFPTDWVEALGPLNRTIRNVRDAAFMLEESSTPQVESLFWVHNRGRGSFFANLDEGGIDLEMGEALIAKLYSQSINKAIRAIVENNLDEALHSYKVAFHYKRPSSDILVTFFERAVAEFSRISPNGNPFAYFYHIFGDDYRPEFEKALVAKTKNETHYSVNHEAQSTPNEAKSKVNSRQKTVNKANIKLPRIEWRKIYPRFVKPWAQFNSWTYFTIVLLVILIICIVKI